MTIRIPRSAWLASLATAAALACQVAAQAADWPAWRGARRDAVVDDFAAPQAWPETLKRLWQVDVGLGHAAPVAVADRIYQFSRQGENETVACYNFAGRQLWSQQYAAPYKMNPAATGHGKGPKSTPLVHGGRVYTLGISGILSCWAADDGRPVWQREFAGDFKNTSPLFGTAMSPLVLGDSLLAHVGGHDGGAFCAFDLATGKTQWAWDEDGPAYTSPIIATLAGTPQIVTQSQKHCLGLAPDGRELWRIPFETQYVQNIVTPVVREDLVIFSGYNRGIHAVRIGSRSGRPEIEMVWLNDDVTMYMNSPVLIGERLLGFSQYKSGQLFCLDAASGKTLWVGPPRAGKNASLTVAGDLLLALTTGGDLIVVDGAAEQYRELARYQVADSPTWAHLAVVGQRFLVKDEKSLSAWTLPD